MIATLCQLLEAKDPALVTELQAMLSSNCKAELEALYSVVGLEHFSSTMAATLQESCDALYML